MKGILGYDSALRLCWAGDNLNTWDEFCYESWPLVQDHLLVLLTSSPAHSHCAMEALYIIFLQQDSSLLNIFYPPPYFLQWTSYQHAILALCYNNYSILLLLSHAYFHSILTLVLQQKCNYRTLFRRDLLTIAAQTYDTILDLHYIFSIHKFFVSIYIKLGCAECWKSCQ